MTNVFQRPGRPTYAEIDLKALVFNYRQIEKRIRPGVGILGIVKADAYGHGAIPVARRLEELGSPCLGVAISDEGVQLRKGGIKAPILVFSGVFPEDVHQFLKFDLTPVVFQKESLRLLSKASEGRRKKLKVHLKVDTGMGRLGVRPESWGAFLTEVKRFPNVEVEGILSHFSMTDEEEIPYTVEQWGKFQEALAVTQGARIFPRYVHIASSANLAAFPSYSGNLVRPGIILYGAYPSVFTRQHLQIKPLMTLKTRVQYLKTVPAGTRISYGGAVVSKRESLIATLSVGYADGYSRRLSNQGEVLIRGRRAPVVGRVCMDFIMADVSDIPGVAMGDEVVLLGKQGKEQIPAEEIAQKTGTIAYEVFCLIGKRVPRVYKG